MSQEPVIDLLNRASGKRVLCIGDLMLDRFIYGDVRRVSPEAPIPILRKSDEREMLGAVGNVARNVASLGGVAVLIGVVGDDAEGRRLADLVGEEEGIEGDLLPVRGRRTTLKTRFVAGGQQLLRVDVEDAEDISPAVEADLIRSINEEIPNCAAVLLSDYAKGAVTQAVIDALLASAKEAGVPVIADPKGLKFDRYREVTLLKPNASELAAALGMPTETDKDIERALEAAQSHFPAEAVLVTRSSKGMSFQRRGEALQHLRARPLEVFDVSGAGDTSLAALGLGFAAGADLYEISELALAASSVAVTKVGTAAVFPHEVKAFCRGQRTRLDADEKYLALAEAEQQVARWKKTGRRVGFTNGCFDILHPGHVSLLQDARRRCDRLVLGLNSDASVRRLKGATRPINNEDARASVLAALDAVDLVVLFEEDTPLELIRALKPGLLVKGGDYDLSQIVGAEDVQSWGGEVYIAPLVQGHSTTRIIEEAQLAKPRD